MARRPNEHAGQPGMMMIVLPLSAFVAGLPGSTFGGRLGFAHELGLDAAHPIEGDDCPQFSAAGK